MSRVIKLVLNTLYVFIPVDDGLNPGFDVRNIYIYPRFVPFGAPDPMRYDPSNHPLASQIGHQRTAAVSLNRKEEI